VPGHEGIVGNETADQLARTRSEHPFTGPEPACGISTGVAKKAVRDWMKGNRKKYWESTTGLKQAKGLTIWALCQKNEGSVKFKQRSIKMDGRTTYWALPPKRTPFQNGVDR
jgi:ribonuclease HI